MAKASVNSSLGSKFKIDDIIVGKRGGKKRLIMGVEVQPDGKIYYNYYNGLVEIKPETHSLTTKNMGRCNETTMLGWGTKK